MRHPRDAETEYEQRINDALADYLRRVDSSSLHVESFLDEYPEFSAQLRQLLETVGLIERMAGPTARGDARNTSESESLHKEVAVPETCKGPAVAQTTEVEQGATSERRRLKQSGDEPRDIFGDYELLETIGRGGMGVVFKAR